MYILNISLIQAQLSQMEKHNTSYFKLQEPWYYEQYGTR